MVKDKIASNNRFVFTVLHQQQDTYNYNKVTVTIQVTNTSRIQRCKLQMDWFRILVGSTIMRQSNFPFAKPKNFPIWPMHSFGVLCGSFLPCVRFLGTADKENRSRRSGLCSSDSTRNQLGVEFYSGCLELRCPMCRHFSFGSGTWLGTCNAN